MADEGFPQQEAPNFEIDISGPKDIPGGAQQPAEVGKQPAEFEDFMDEVADDTAAPQAAIGGNPTINATATDRSETVNTLPASASFQEAARVYPESCTSIHREYRGQDVPGFMRGKGSVDHKQMALVCARVPGSGHIEEFGSPVYQEEENFVRFSLGCDSQLPALRFHVSRKGAPRVATMLVFSTLLAESYGTADLNFSMYKDTNYTDEFVNERDDLTDLCGTNELWETRLNLRPSQGDSARRVWIGISRPEIDEIVTALLGNQRQSRADRLIALLELGQSLWVFCRWDSNRVDELRRSLIFFNQAMQMSFRYGTFWFYANQALMTRKENADFPWRNMEVPRWLATKWVVRSDGQNARAYPTKWACFKRLPLYPDPNTFGFFCRLALNREKQYQEQAIRRMVDSKKANIRATFHQNPYLRGSFVVDMVVAGFEMDMAFSVPMPAIETMVTLHVEAEDQVTRQKKRLQYSGRIIEDHFGSKAQIVAFVTGERFDFADAEHDVTLLLRSDATSLNREILAVELIQQGQRRQEGVDIPALVLCAPPVLTRAPGALAAGVSPVQRRDYEHIITLWKLNPDQHQSALAAVQSQDGVTLCHGPPGTGKTNVAMAVAHGFVAALRKKVLVCGPSNESVDNALEKLTGRAPDLRAVRFRSAYIPRPGNDTEGARSQLPQVNASQIAELDEGSLAWVMVMRATEAGSLAGNRYAYNAQLLDFIRATAQRPGMPLAQTANEYLTTLRGLRDRRSKQTRQQLIKLSTLEEQLSIVFWETVDVVFSTCNSSCHDAMYGRFKPDFIIIDEAGQATAPTVGIPLAAFMETLQGVMLVGDHHQLLPVAVSEGRNECYEALRQSLFEALIEDPQQRYKRTMLTMQYRMHPDISEWISQAFYDNALNAADSTKRVTGIDVTLNALFRRFGPAWNGRRRMAFDVSRGAESVRYLNSKSSQNLAEIARVQRLLEMLFESRPPVPGAVNIRPENVTVITPYAGQKRALVQALLLSGGMLARVRVRTTAQMQGQETDIAIISFVANKPGEPTQLGFIKQKNQLNVELSRAKQFEILVGNFLAWCQADEDKNEHKNEDSNKDKIEQMIRRQTETFNSLIRSLRSKGDIISEHDWATVEANLTPATRNFECFITKKPAEQSGSGRGRGRGHARGYGASGANGRGGATAMERSRFDPRDAVRGFGQSGHRGGNRGGRGRGGYRAG